jgi:group II intron reverse transcriptase/maturase
LGQVYRQLYNPELYLYAYSKIGRNKGAMTPGVTDETVDGMSRDKIYAITDALREEKYRFNPVRRIYIEKKNSDKKRPLGIPTWSNKLVQEAMRMMLEAYYEPQFSEFSHGFRPNRGCHTALSTIVKKWTGTIWFIEGDVKGCFDNIKHDVLVKILREKITDNRFMRLIESLLKAGYMEEWTYKRTYSGTPQGGVISPLLANIYLDRLDKFVEQTLIPKYTLGKQRARNPEYEYAQGMEHYYRKKGNLEKAEEFRKKKFTMPSKDTQDPNYRRLKYMRYADDFILGFAGPKTEAEEIKAEIAKFLQETLKLDLSEEKTLITHGRDEKARFLGYDIQVGQCDTWRCKSDKREARDANGNIRLLVPNEVITAQIRRYQVNGQTKNRPELLEESDFTIVNSYQSRFRGLANFYQLAHDRSKKLSELKGVMEHSMMMTLANKHKTPVSNIYQKYSTLINHSNGKAYKGLEVRIERDGKEPLIARWGGISLERVRDYKKVVLMDKIELPRISTTEMVKNMLKTTCALCGSTENIQVHHVRALKDLKGKAFHERMMAARRRKTINVCHKCHVAIHQGQV